MDIRWGRLSAKSKKALRAGWLITAGMIALQFGLVGPRARERSIAAERSTGLASVAGGEWEPVSLWRHNSIFPIYAQSVDSAKIRGSQAQMAAQAYLTNSEGGGGGGGGDADKEDRRLIRNTSISLVVRSPVQSAESIVRIAKAANGYLETSQVNGGDNMPLASIAIRVPAARFEEVRAQVRQLALRVEGESMEARDVTKQYVDQEARLRNLRAEEQQYLNILRKAATVKDTLEVSGKLDEVRGAIEERQAEFAALSKQVETVAISITLRAEADAQVFGLQWRPLYQLKFAAREGLDGFGDYAASMTAFVFYLPTILLWLFTILAGAAAGWRILRWAARVFFLSWKTHSVDSTARP